MKKGLILVGAAMLTFAICQNAQSAAYVYNKTGPTTTITVAPTNIPNSENIVFQNSAQVVMAGSSDLTGYAHSSFHTQVNGKKNGRQFGMSGDVANIFWQDIETTGVVLTSITVTNSSAFPHGSGANWAKM